MPLSPPPTLTPSAYNTHITTLRPTEYPQLHPATLHPSQTTPLYLDHASHTPPPATALHRFTTATLAHLHGNPHSSSSGSASSQRSARVVEAARARVLEWCGAGGGGFEVVFVANATAGVKVVGEGMRDRGAGVGEGWGFGYWEGCHTSVVGLREMVGEGGGAECLGEGEVGEWIRQGEGGGRRRLLAYPAQSNLDGRRLGLEWCRQVKEIERQRRQSEGRTYTLLDAAALASTARLDLSDMEAAPDFTVLSLYKIFGFPDLGALIVRKDAAELFDGKKYFGGGTVDMVIASRREQWHALKAGPLHERLEDGTLPIHSILALDSAMQTHEELFGSLEEVSRHAARLAQRLHDGLAALRHRNGQEVCMIHKQPDVEYIDTARQGPIVALNFINSRGEWVSNAEVEKLASIKEIHLRTGSVCNPGGVASALNLAPWEMRENFSSGHRCGSDDDILGGKPTGVVRLSLGAMSTESDVERFLSFVDEFFVEKNAEDVATQSSPRQPGNAKCFIEHLTVYPIKSCGGWDVPPSHPWEARPTGLAWDREWCVVHQNTSKALSQKQYPKMALLRPQFDFEAGLLRIQLASDHTGSDISVPLSNNPTLFTDHTTYPTRATVCGDAISTRTYTSPTIAAFLTTALAVPCTLARFNPSSNRHSKPHLQRQPLLKDNPHHPLHLSNESPILTITRPSLAALNAELQRHSPTHTPIPPSTFRPNIVLAPADPSVEDDATAPWAEDAWQRMRLLPATGTATHEPTPGAFTFLAPCTRCQMVCVNQTTGEKTAGGEPLATLAKMRRRGGRVVFGLHTAVEGRGLMVEVGREVWVG